MHKMEVQSCAPASPWLYCAEAARLFVLLILTCIAIPVLAYSDGIDIYPISTTPRLLLSGKIGNYTVTMNLFLYPETVYGNYSYVKRNSSLELIGALDYDKVRLYEYVDHQNTGVFEGKILVDKIVGIWRPVNNKRASPLPFSLSLELGTFETHSSRFVSGNIFLIRSGENAAFLDLSKEISNRVYSCKTVFSDTKNKHHYVVIRLEGFSLDACRERSACGCGIETQFVWIDLDPEFNISRKTVAYVVSCVKNISLDQGDVFEKFFSDREQTKLQVKGTSYAESNKFSIEFDKNSPEKGFVVTTEPINK